MIRQLAPLEILSPIAPVPLALSFLLLLPGEPESKYPMVHVHHPEPSPYQQSNYQYREGIIVPINPLERLTHPRDSKSFPNFSKQHYSTKDERVVKKHRLQVGLSHAICHSAGRLSCAATTSCSSTAGSRSHIIQSRVGVKSTPFSFHPRIT